MDNIQADKLISYSDKVNVEKIIVETAKSIESDKLSRYMRKDVSDLIIKRIGTTPKLISPMLNRISSRYEKDCDKDILLSLADEFDMINDDADYSSNTVMVDIASSQSDGTCRGTFLMYRYRKDNNKTVVDMLIVQAVQKISIDYQQIGIELISAIILGALIPGYGMAEVAMLLTPIAALTYDAHQVKLSNNEIKSKALLLRSLEQKNLVKFTENNEVLLLLSN